MGELPSGLVTFVFTDIEGSTQLFRRIGDRFGDMLERHRVIVREALEAHHGAEVKTEGDGFFLAFSSPTNAVRFCAAAQRALLAEPWPDDSTVRVRMGLHCGEAEPVDDDYVALAVHQAARVSGAAHGGQVLVTAAVLDRADPGEEAGLARLGAFRLKDFEEPVDLFELRGPSLPSGFPAIRAIPAAAHNVPVLFSSFVGRENELIELADLLRNNRIVTVTGAGGAGKTRVAFELATTLAPAYADGAWVVLLATLDDAADLPGRVAQAVGVREEPALPVVDSLTRQLAGRRMLLVLDNCEHLIEPAAALVDQLLAVCPQLTVLATSREPLRLAGEHVWRLPPLSLPPTESLEVDALARIDAVRLFADRAQASDPSFTLDASTAPPVVEVCRQLDGIPLAIELAAARLRHLSVSQIAERLSDRLKLLTGGGRDVLPRQRTLRATVEWSHDLLSDQERVLFRRLAVFRGRFSLAAVEDVCADHLLPEADILDRLADLVDKSLVSLADDKLGLRYRMLVTLREYAAEMLTAAEEATTFQQLHATYVRHQPGLRLFTSVRSPPTSAEIELVRSQQDDIRAVFDWAMVTEDVDMALEVAYGWATYAFYAARYRDGRPWCERALQLPGGDPEMRGLTLYRAGHLAVIDGDFATCRALADELLEHARTHQFEVMAMNAHHLLGDVGLLAGDPLEARLHYNAALEQANPDPLPAAILRRSLGDVARALGDLTSAEASYRDALAEIRGLGSAFETARTLVGLGWMLGEQGVDEALDALREAHLVGADVSAPGVMVAAVAGLGALAVQRGRQTEGAALFGAAECLAERWDTSLRAALWDYDRLPEMYAAKRQLLVETLSPDDLAAAWARGRVADTSQLCDDVFGAADARR